MLYPHFSIKLSIVTLVMGVLITFFPGLLLAENSTDQELVFLNWFEYMDPDLVTKFEQQYQVKLRQPYFDSDDNRSDMLVETDTAGYDIVMVDSASLNLYRKAGWLEKIDTSRIPNYRHINPRWINALPDSSEYTVPYLWGTLGIAYRKDLIDKPPTTWMDLFRPSKQLQGKIGMFRNTVDIVGAALKSMGHSINDTSLSTLDQVEQLLLEQKPYVYSYDFRNLDENSTLVTGQVVAGMFYSNDTLMLKEFNENIEFMIPPEGGSIWIDHLVVMKSSRNKELAWQFINFLNEPENAVQLAQYVHGPSPNQAAEKLLPEKFLQNSVIYPDSAALAKSEFNQPLPSRVIKKRNRIVSESGL